MVWLRIMSLKSVRMKTGLCGFVPWEDCPNMMDSGLPITIFRRRIPQAFLPITHINSSETAGADIGSLPITVSISWTERPENSGGINTIRIIPTVRATI